MRTGVAIVGAGPTGLEADLAASEAALDFTVFEAADGPAGHVRSWGHVRLFTPWAMNVSPRARTRLEAARSPVPDSDVCPTGHELVEMLLGPIAGLPDVARHVRYGARVLEIGREGYVKSDEIGTGRRAERPFRLVVDEGGRERVVLADVVLDCTGTYSHPNALGTGGVRAPGERALEGRIDRRIPDVANETEAWAGRRVLLVGAGHSGQTVAGELAALCARHPATTVVWAIRGDDRDFGAIADDPLRERAALASRACELTGTEGPLDVRWGWSVDALKPDGEAIAVTLRSAAGDATDEVVVDRIVAMTGSVGDHSLYRQLQVHECYATSGPMKLAAALLAESSVDCLEQTSQGADTLRNPEPNFYIVGAKSYGRNTTFLMRVGWEQVGEVFSMIAANRPVAGARP